MAKLTGDSPVVAELATALGLNGARWLELRMGVGEVVTVTAETFVTDEQLNAVKSIVRRYNLTIDDGKPVRPNPSGIPLGKPEYITKGV
jgi:hypothetical protein